METLKPASTSKLTAAVRVSIYQNVLTGQSSALPFQILLESRSVDRIWYNLFSVGFWCMNFLYKLINIYFFYFYTELPVRTAGGICTRSQWLDCTLYKHTVRILSMSFLIVLRVRELYFLQFSNIWIICMHIYTQVQMCGS